MPLELIYQNEANLDDKKKFTIDISEKMLQKKNL